MKRHDHMHFSHFGPNTCSCMIIEHTMQSNRGEISTICGCNNYHEETELRAKDTLWGKSSRERQSSEWALSWLETVQICKLDIQRQELNAGKYTPKGYWEKGSSWHTSSMMLLIHTDKLRIEHHQASHTPVTHSQTWATQCSQGKEQKEHQKMLICKSDVMAYSKRTSRREKSICMFWQRLAVQQCFK